MTQDTPSAIRLAFDGAVARLTLDRPERHNALTADDVRAFVNALDRVDDSDARALIVTGSGDRTFCSGASLEEIESGALSGRIFSEATERLAHFRLPTVCAINGRIYGGGGELALSCDFRLGTEATSLRVPASQLGICYPPVGIERYGQRVGPGTAARILLAGEEMGGAELYRVGFLTHFANVGSVPTEATSLAGHLARLAPLAVQAMKRILNHAASGTLNVEEAAVWEAACNASEDLREGLAAWREKRPPTFRGE